MLETVFIGAELIYNLLEVIKSDMVGSITVEETGFELYSTAGIGKISV